MRRTRLFGVAGVVAGLLWWGTVPAAAAPVALPCVVVLTEVTTSFVPVDVAPAGPSSADSFTFADGRDFRPYDQTTYQSGGRVVVLSVGTAGTHRGRAGT